MQIIVGVTTYSVGKLVYKRQLDIQFTAHLILQLASVKIDRLV